MKTIKHLGIFFTIFFLISGCSKEFSAETGLTAHATGSLKDLFDNCQPVTINGTYTAGKTLNDSNSVVVQVNFSSPGTYNIFTDTVNGFYFSDSAYTVDSGLQSITLKAAGKPDTSLATDFTVFFDTSFCTFSVPVISNIPATYTLQGTPNSCSDADVQGTYATSNPLLSGNKVVLQVNVTSIGYYSVSTDVVNGISFRGAGNFTTTGVQTITLQGSGTPDTEGTTTIPLTAGSSTCSFDVEVEMGTTPVATDTAWNFTQGGKFYYGSEDGASFISQSGVGALALSGSNAAGDTSFSIGITMIGASSVKTGTYKSNTGAIFYLTDDAGNFIFKSDPTTTNAIMTIIIETYDDATKIVTGSFSGNAQNGGGAVVPITTGKFKMKLD